jgi:uncharacterized protein YgiM (DUF1202 family)
MRSFRFSGLRILIASLLLFIFALPAYAQETIVYVGRLPLNLRTGPGPAFPSVAELQPGEALAVTGQSGVWLNVTRLATGETGWVNRNYVTGSVPAVAPPPVVAVAPNQVAVGKLPVNLRTGPGPSYPRLAELPPGEVLTVIARAGTWLNVTRAATGETGWVHGDYVTGTVPAASALPVAAPTSIATPPPDATPAPPSSSTVNAIVSDGPLNFREGPGKNYRVILRLPTGQSLTLLSESGAWASVQLPSGTQGWVMTRYLTKVDAATAAASCREGDVLTHVHDPERLTLFNRCVTASGTVAEISRNPDGDLTFRLALDPAYAYLLNDGNRNMLRGTLQIEIIPADQPFAAEPALGAHVTVTGAYVLDTEYGWMEIHPAWFVGP